MAGKSATQHYNYTAGGKYIPQGGGSRGWFENSGVAVSERMNHYRYHEGVDSQAFRHVLDEREGAERRAEERTPVELRVLYGTGDAPPEQRGFCHGLSLRGAGLRLRDELRSGTPLTVVLLARRAELGEDQPLVTVTGAVEWSMEVKPRGRSPRYDCGVRLDELTPEQSSRIGRILAGEIDNLLPDVPPDQGQAESLEL